MEKQDKLYNISLQRLTVRIVDGLDPKYMIGNLMNTTCFHNMSPVWLNTAVKKQHGTCLTQQFSL
jgi:hypothetical protein